MIVSTTRAAAMLHNHNFASSRTRRVVAVSEIAVDERDRHSQREENMTLKDNPPRVKRMCRVSLVGSTILLLHGLRCSGATGPMCPGRKRKSLGSAFAYRMVLYTILPLLGTSICDNVLSQNNLKTRAMIRLSTEFCTSGLAARKKMFVFGSQSCSIRDGLRP